MKKVLIVLVAVSAFIALTGFQSGEVVNNDLTVAGTESGTIILSGDVAISGGVLAECNPLGGKVKKYVQVADLSEQGAVVNKVAGVESGTKTITAPKDVIGLVETIAGVWTGGVVNNDLTVAGTESGTIILSGDVAISGGVVETVAGIKMGGFDEMIAGVQLSGATETVAESSDITGFNKALA